MTLCVAARTLKSFQKGEEEGGGFMAATLWFAAVAVRDALRSLVVSRALVWAAAMLAVLRFGVEATVNAPPDVTRFGWAGTLLTAPASAWDAGHYVAIADRGYDELLRAAFFPLYPLLARGVGWPIGSSLLGAIVVSLAALGVALYLLHRLVALEVGERYARPAVAVVALFPTAFFFSAIYTESLFLALTIGAFYAARRERWAIAGLVGALAAATRNTGVLLVLPLLLLPAARRRDRLWIAVIPVGLLAVLAYWAHRGNFWAPFDAQKVFWGRETQPLGGLVHGAWDGAVSVAQLAAGPSHHLLATPGPEASGQLAQPLTLATVNLTDLAFVVFAIVALVGVARRLPLAYTAYTAAALAVAVSAPTRFEPLMSLPRYVAVFFPLQIWLAMWAVDRGRLTQTLTVSAAGLALLSAEFATWRWVA